VEALFATIAGLAISGLTLLAYKHPKSSKNLIIALQILAIFFALLLQFYNLGLQAGYYSVNEFIDREKIAKADQAYKEEIVPIIYMFCLWAFAAYCWFLTSILPWLTRNDSEKEVEK
jgi:hypothetical protein